RMMTPRVYRVVPGTDEDIEGEGQTDPGARRQRFASITIRARRRNTPGSRASKNRVKTTKAIHTNMVARGAHGQRVDDPSRRPSTSAPVKPRGRPAPPAPGRRG